MSTKQEQTTKINGGSTTAGPVLSYPNNVENIDIYPDTILIKIFSNKKALKSTFESGSTVGVAGNYGAIAAAAPRAFQDNALGLKLTKPYYKSYDKYVLLPSPNDLAVNQSANWSETELGMGAGMAGNVMDAVRAAGALDGTGALSAAKGVMSVAGSTMKQSMTASLISAGTGGNGEAILQAESGQVVNSNVEVLFQNQSARAISLPYKCLPQNASESANIKEILRILRGFSAVAKMSGGTTFLSPPALFEVIFLHDGKENENIPKLSTMALTKVDVNYTAAGSSSFFVDGAPVAIDFTLQFMEIEIICKNRILDEGY